MIHEKEKQAKLELLHELMRVMSHQDGDRLPKMVKEESKEPCPECGKYPCECEEGYEEGEKPEGSMKVVATGDVAEDLKDKLDEMMKQRGIKKG